MSEAPGEIARPEFSRIVRLDEIGRMQWPAHIEADETERAALARRFGFVLLDVLEADYRLERHGAAIVASGEIRAVLAQPCVATGEPVAEQLFEHFTVRFLPEQNDAAHKPDEEIELDANECDTLLYSGERIDIGEAIAETLALAVNPYPRSPDAEAYLRAAGVKSEEEAQAESGPFAALAALKGKAGS